jgi:hypothetical protein
MLQVGIIVIGEHSDDVLNYKVWLAFHSAYVEFNVERKFTFFSVIIIFFIVCFQNRFLNRCIPNVIFVYVSLSLCEIRQKISYDTLKSKNEIQNLKKTV